MRHRGSNKSAVTAAVLCVTATLVLGACDQVSTPYDSEPSGVELTNQTLQVEDLHAAIDADLASMSPDLLSAMCAAMVSDPASVRATLARANEDLMSQVYAEAEAEGYSVAPGVTPEAASEYAWQALQRKC